MVDILELLKSDATISDKINKLKEKPVDVPKWDELVKMYEPSRHFVMTDQVDRKDKTTKSGTIEKAARIPIGLEKLLVKRMSEFAFALPVKRTYSNIEGSDVRGEIAKAMEAIYKHARIDTENRNRGLAYYASCEVCTIWYLQESSNNLYGFDCKYKLKAKSISPLKGYELYPCFDNNGDMVAMAFQFDVTVGTETETYFECYTSDHHYRWRSQSNGWEVVLDDKITLLKIPCIYAYSNEAMYKDLVPIRNEIEYTLSRNSDVIAYNSAPVLKIVGQTVGQEDKGETQRVFRLMSGGDVQYVSWSQAIEALKYHVETLLNMYWSQAQMPDISFEKMKSLGNIGYDARRTLLTDAHLKVGDESGMWIEYFEREANIIKAYLKIIRPEWASELDSIDVGHVISPFIQNDETEEINKVVRATGGKAVMSQLEGIQKLGISNDAKATLEQIQQEEAAASQASIAGLFESAQ